MKYLVKFFVVTFIYLICTSVSAEQKIAFIDMKYILNMSDAGKGAQDFLKKSFEKNQEKLLEEEKGLKKEESDLLSKKSSFSKEDYKKKSDELRKKVLKYQSKRRQNLETVAKKRADARQKLLKAIDPILISYVKENNISLVIDKKNVVLGNNDLNITNIIIEKLNKDLPSLNLK
tara:strand:+ start:138 stop:662 length:525 start_codon:yes stop_codon:yes gene_type:complete